MDKSKSLYNFHAHTYRCGHASDERENEYLNAAISKNYSKYGFTDHVPVHPIFYWDNGVRMHNLEALEYLNCINKLKAMYRDIIDVYTGFESEYDEIIEEHLCELRDKCDYMILGQHYVLNRDIRKTSDYPIEYAKKVCRAIESGIFDIVAHPDIFMQNRFYLEGENLNKFLSNALIAAKMICEKALEYNIPLELNLGGMELLLQEVDGEYLDQQARYPTRLFWEVVSSYGNDVLIGVDAHSVEDIHLRDKKLEQIGRYIDFSNLKFLDSSYDPVKARVNNPKLMEAYNSTKCNLSSLEGRLVDSVVLEYIDLVDIDTLLSIITNSLKDVRFRRRQTNLDYITLEKREELSKVIKDSVSRMGKVNKDDFRYTLKRDIDNYYSKSLVKRKIMVD